MAVETSPAADRPPFSARFLEQYEVLGILGEGGMGRVYRAHQKSMDRVVALKVLKSLEKDDAARFEREALILGSLQHARILRLFDAGVDGTIPYLVCELASAETLEELLGRGPLTLRQSLEYAEKLADALSCAHSLGVAHRDVKPANVFVFPDGEVKLADFGLARHMACGGTLTATGLIMGTPHYMSPEQTLGERGSPSSDQYSLGVTLYRMITGSLPFSGPSMIVVAMARLNEPPPSPRARSPRVPDEVDAVVVRTLQREPDGRFESCAALRSRLLEILAGLGPEGDRTCADRVEGDSLAQAKAATERSGLAEDRAASVPDRTITAASNPEAEAATPLRPRKTLSGRTALRASRQVPVLVLPPPRKPWAKTVAGTGMLIAAVLGVAWWALGPGSGGQAVVPPAASPTPSPSSSAAAVATDDVDDVATQLVASIRDLNPRDVSDAIAASIKQVGVAPYENAARAKLDAERARWSGRLLAKIAEKDLVARLAKFVTLKERFFNGPAARWQSRLQCYLDLQRLLTLQMQCLHPKLGIAFPLDVTRALVDGWGLPARPARAPAMTAGRGLVFDLAGSNRRWFAKLSEDPWGGAIDLLNVKEKGVFFTGAPLMGWGNEAALVTQATSGETDRTTFETEKPVELPPLDRIDSLALSLEVSALREENYLLVHLLDKGQAHNPVAIFRDTGKNRSHLGVRCWHVVERPALRSNRVTVKIEFHVIPNLPTGGEEVRVHRLGLHWRLKAAR